MQSTSYTSVFVLKALYMRYLILKTGHVPNIGTEVGTIVISIFQIKK